MSKFNACRAFSTSGETVSKVQGCVAIVTPLRRSAGAVSTSRGTVSKIRGLLQKVQQLPGSQLVGKTYKKKGGLISPPFTLCNQFVSSLQSVLQCFLYAPVSVQL